MWSWRNKENVYLYYLLIVWKNPIYKHHILDLALQGTAWMSDILLANYKLYSLDLSYYQGDVSQVAESRSEIWDTGRARADWSDYSLHANVLSPWLGPSQA